MCRRENQEEHRLRCSRIVLLDERKTVASGPGRAARWLEPFGKEGDSCGGRLLGKCIRTEAEIAALELLTEPEEAEDCLRYILKHAKRRGSRIFDTKEKNDHPVASSRRWLEHQGERVALQESCKNDQQYNMYEGIVAKAFPYSERSMRERRCRSKVPLRTGRKEASGVVWRIGAPFLRRWPKQC